MAGLRRSSPALSLQEEPQLLFVIHALDRKGALAKRLAHYDAHKTFLSDTTEYEVRIVMSGPLTEGDAETMIGSLFIVEAPDRGAVHRFNAADPFYAAEIWERISITGFVRRQG
jgi:uncharacterized protein